MLILILVVVTAVCFDFTNGFHDTANAVATSIATGALKPRVAVMMSAVLNLIGAFVSIKVAATIAKGIVDPARAQGQRRPLARVRRADRRDPLEPDHVVLHAALQSPATR